MDITLAPEFPSESDRFGPHPAAPRRAAPAVQRASAAPQALAAARPVRPDGGSHAVGVGVVLAVHLLVGYAFVSGLAQKVVDAVRAPVDVRLIEEVKPPPPEPPKPVVKLAPRLAPPPPAYVPPPQVEVAAPPPAPTITAVSQQPVVDAKPTPAPLPVAPPTAPAPVSISVVCPTMVRPTLPLRAEQEGLGGVVRAQATIRAGKVVRVDILSSRPRGLFDAAVRNAMLQYGCQGGGAEEIVATQNFEFRAGE